AGVDRPRRHRGRGAGQRPGAAAGLLEQAEALVLRGGADLRDVERAVGGTAERQRVGGTERNHIAAEAPARLQLAPIVAAGGGDGFAGRGSGDAARDAAAVEDREARAADAHAAQARGAGAAAGATGNVAAVVDDRDARAADARAADAEAAAATGPALAAVD